jgi:hypothetical protein
MHGNIPTGAAAKSRVSGYVGYNNTPRVLYRAQNAHIYEMALGQTAWIGNDMTAITTRRQQPVNRSAF